jgi:hypothetical protein
MAQKGVISAKLPDHSRPQFHLSLLGALALLGMWRHLAAKVVTSKGRGKQWQTTPKNLPRIQRTRVIPVAWLGSGSCQTRPKAWIPIISSVYRHTGVAYKARITPWRWQLLAETFRGKFWMYNKIYNDFEHLLVISHRNTRCRSNYQVNVLIHWYFDAFVDPLFIIWKCMVQTAKTKDRTLTVWILFLCKLKNWLVQWSFLWVRYNFWASGTAYVEFSHAACQTLRNGHFIQY